VLFDNANASPMPDPNKPRCFGGNRTAALRRPGCLIPADISQAPAFSKRFARKKRAFPPQLP
jgi:hypothetical protein